MPTTFANVLDAIVHMNSGELVQLEQTIAMRRRQLGVTANFGSLPATAYRIGNVVKMNNRIRPAYLRGLTATVIAVNRTTVSVCCPVDPRYGRFSGCPRVRLPISLIAGVVNSHISTPANNGEDDGLSAEREMQSMLRTEGGDDD